MATNPYFEPLRLELMQIDQTWTKVSISLEIYEENHFDRGDCLGTEHSRNARITECERKYCDFDFQYLHDSRSKKDSFGGSFFLKYTYRKQEKKKEIYELTGEYSTTKSGKDRFGKDFNGVAGRIAFRRVSLRILELKEILRESEYHFFEIKKEMTSQIREFSKN